MQLGGRHQWMSAELMPVKTFQSIHIYRSFLCLMIQFRPRTCRECIVLFVRVCPSSECAITILNHNILSNLVRIYYGMDLTEKNEQILRLFFWSPNHFHIYSKTRTKEYKMLKKFYTKKRIQSICTICISSSKVFRQIQKFVETALQKLSTHIRWRYWAWNR